MPATGFWNALLANIAANAADVITVTISGVIAVVGTLWGVRYANKHNERVDAARREHEEHARFHDDRVKAYVDFNDACAVILAVIQLDVRLPEEAAARDDRFREGVRRINDSYGRIRLLGSSSVVEPVELIQQHVARLMNNRALFKGAEQAVWEKEMAIYKRNFPAMRDAMRKELGLR